MRNYEEDNHNATHPYHDLPEGPAKQLFSQLDKDGDGYVNLRKSTTHHDAVKTMCPLT